MFRNLKRRVGRKQSAKKALRILTMPIKLQANRLPVY